MERWYLLITEKFLFWTFQRLKMRGFFEPKSWWKDDIYWLLKSSCFELFGDGKYGLFFSQKVHGKMIVTSSFWVFHDIPGLGKYGFSCSEWGIFSKLALKECLVKTQTPLQVFLKDFAKLKLSVLTVWKFKNTIFIFQWLLLQLKESIIIQHPIGKSTRQEVDRKSNYASEVPVIIQNSHPLPAS